MNRTQKQKGQVLVIAVILIVLLLLGIFIFFDVHNVIRAKMKLETAEQAAALAAARWQGETLNLIGEMNLVIASESLLSGSQIDVPIATTDNPAEYDFENAAARVKTIGEMQSRISFLGPLVALAAAQQAAKNNGIKVPADSRSPYQSFALYLNRLNDAGNPRYSSDSVKKVNNYYWRENYAALLSAIIDNGIAVRPNDRTTGLQNIRLLGFGWYPEELQMFFKAIIACDKGYNNWCNYMLRMIVKSSTSYTEDWFRPSFAYMYFPRQSEIYSADVTGIGRTADPAELKAFLESNGVDVMPTIDGNLNDNYHQINLAETPLWYGYEQRWYASSGVYNGPSVAWYSPWRRGFFLQSDLKPSVIHGGALAYAECYVSTGAVTEFRASAKTGSAGLGNPVQKKSMSSTRVGGNFAEEYVASGVVAKPLGDLEGNPPTALPVVLPVFDRVAVIPSTMQNYRVFTASIQPLENFLQWLGGLSVEDFNDPTITAPSGSEYALEALRILANPDFRKRGYNPDFSGLDALPPMSLFDDGYKYPNNPNGAGWLQQACIRTDSNPPPDATSGVLYYYNAETAQKLNEDQKTNNAIPLKKKTRTYPAPPDGDTWVFNGKQYFIIHNGKILNNEDDPIAGCAVQYGGSGGGTSGSNSGPSRL